MNPSKPTDLIKSSFDVKNTGYNHANSRFHALPKHERGLELSNSMPSKERKLSLSLSSSGIEDIFGGRVFMEASNKRVLYTGTLGYIKQKRKTSKSDDIP